MKVDFLLLEFQGRLNAQRISNFNIEVKLDPSKIPLSAFIWFKTKMYLHLFSVQSDEILVSGKFYCLEEYSKNNCIGMFVLRILEKSKPQQF
jgi:hypothetical protein